MSVSRQSTWSYDDTIIHPIGCLIVVLPNLKSLHKMYSLVDCNLKCSEISPITCEPRNTSSQIITTKSIWLAETFTTSRLSKVNWPTCHIRKLGGERTERMQWKERRVAWHHVYSVHPSLGPSVRQCCAKIYQKKWMVTLPRFLWVTLKQKQQTANRQCSRVVATHCNHCVDLSVPAATRCKVGMKAVVARPVLFVFQTECS